MPPRIQRVRYQQREAGARSREFSILGARGHSWCASHKFSAPRSSRQVCPWSAEARDPRTARSGGPWRESSPSRSLGGKLMQGLMVIDESGESATFRRNQADTAAGSGSPVALRVPQGWPSFSSTLAGRNEVRVTNPNDFAVTAGLRPARRERTSPYRPVHAFGVRPQRSLRHLLSLLERRTGYLPRRQLHAGGQTASRSRSSREPMGITASARLNSNVTGERLAPLNPGVCGPQV